MLVYVQVHLCVYLLTASAGMFSGTTGQFPHDGNNKAHRSGSLLCLNKTKSNYYQLSFLSPTLVDLTREWGCGVGGEGREAKQMDFLLLILLPKTHVRAIIWN